MRPIVPDDARWLIAGLKRMTPASRVRRFFFDKQAYSKEELRELTRYDEKRHLALVLAITNSAGVELDAVAVVRLFRDPIRPQIAEFAVATVDEWQRRGIGTVLVQRLATCAWDAGIRRWRAVFNSANEGTRKLLSLVANLESERWISSDCIEATYVLHPPTPALTS